MVALRNRCSSSRCSLPPWTSTRLLRRRSHRWLSDLRWRQATASSRLSWKTSDTACARSSSRSWAVYALKAYLQSWWSRRTTNRPIKQSKALNSIKQKWKKSKSNKLNPLLLSSQNRRTTNSRLYKRRKRRRIKRTKRRRRQMERLPRSFVLRRRNQRRSWATSLRRPKSLQRSATKTPSSRLPQTSANMRIRPPVPKLTRDSGKALTSRWHQAVSIAFRKSTKKTKINKTCSSRYSKKWNKF